MTPSLTDTTERRTRLMVAIAFALISVVLARRTILNPAWPTDFDQLWHAARALLSGENPYSVVGPGRQFSWGWPLYYPLPAVLLTTPFASLSVPVARIAFSTIAAATLGWATGSRIRTHWPMLLSASFIISVTRTQWTTLLLAATWLPAMGFAIAAKPTVGLASLASLRGRALVVACAGCAGLVALSFMVQPDWLAHWLDAIGNAPHIRPAILVLPAGPLLALAALRWKRSDARLFLALVIVPHTPSLYDLLVLFYLCRTFRESLSLAALTQVLFWGLVANGGSLDNFDTYAATLGDLQVFVIYLPALVLLLLRPNANETSDPTTSGSAQPLTLVPRNWTDTVLLSVLMAGGTLQILLPFSWRP